VVSCGGGSGAATLAADVARELRSLDIPGLAGTAAGGEPTVALDGCPSACSSRLAAARGDRLVAALNLADLGAGASAGDDPRALAEIAAGRLRREQPSAAPPRPYRHAEPRGRSRPQAHTLDDYLVALDTLSSPVVECGAVLDGAPTIASHVSDALGVSRASAGEMLGTMTAAGLVRRGSRKELFLTDAGRERADVCVRRQRLLEVFVVRFLGYDLAESRSRAESLREAFDGDAIDRLEERLGFPERCPHGWPLDAARGRAETPLLRALPSLRTGERARASRLAEDDEASLRELAEEKLLPGAELVVEAVEPSGALRLVFGERRVVLDERAGRAVLVELLPVP
jgi:DtxR family Mn-dependent transcriptional regulator